MSSCPDTQMISTSISINIDFQFSVLTDTSLETVLFKPDLMPLRQRRKPNTKRNFPITEIYTQINNVDMLNKKWIRKFRYQLLALFLFPVLIVTILIYWCFVANSPSITGKRSWTREHRSLWFNWSSPCWYYRFRTSEGIKNTTTWIEDEISYRQSWSPAMVFDSDSITRTLRTKFHNGDNKDLNVDLFQWSLPALGTGYGMQSSLPFTIVLSSKNMNSVDRYMHFKITNTISHGSVIEYWDFGVLTDF